MKQLLILSGKGGTGKTTIAGAFIKFNDIKAFADCDVDAPNLHMIVELGSPQKTSSFYGLKKAVIDSQKCVKCGLCEKFCRFDAIKNCNIEEFGCEGCGVCTIVCPSKAITMEDNSSGDIILYKNEHNVFSTAKLKMGSGASGKLVSAVKKQLTEESKEKIAIVDGSPGIGCPVIASISGAHTVLIVAEPTISGIHDMKRIINTSKHFGVKCAVCINKYDINQEKSEEIKTYCQSVNIETIGFIPYDKTVIEALSEGKSIASYKDSAASKEILKIWEILYNNYLNQRSEL